MKAVPGVKPAALTLLDVGQDGAHILFNVVLYILGVLFLDINSALGPSRLGVRPLTRSVGQLGRSQDKPISLQ